MSVKDVERTIEARLRYDPHFYDDPNLQPFQTFNVNGVSLLPTLKVAPNPATTGSVVNVTGSSFKNLKTRLLLDGQGATTNVFRPDKNGWFQVGITVSTTPKTQTLVAEQLSGSTWAEVTRTSITVNAPVPSTGWKTVMFEDFLTNQPEGSFNYPNFSVYKLGWHDTTQVGAYNPGIASVANSNLNIHIKTVNGVPQVFAMTALPPGGTTKGGLKNVRVTSKLRADKMVGYKGVPMLWSDLSTTNDLLLQNGENDFPESNFDKQPSAFMHWAPADKFGQQDWYGTPAGTSWQDWHTYTIEYKAGLYVAFLIDGVQIGKSVPGTRSGVDMTKKPATFPIPTSDMHANWQFETNLEKTAIDPNVSGYVQIDWIQIEVPA